jgi:ATP-dependent Clp protease ATP-binding subunit ClpA
VERVSAQARAAVAEADAVARRLAHDYVGTEHLLAGLAIGAGGAARCLAGCGLDGVRVEAGIEALVGRGIRSPAGSPPRTASVGLVLARSRWEARAFGAEQVSTVHLLLALLHQPDATAAGVLRELGVDPVGLESRLVLDGRSADEGPGSQVPAPTVEAPTVEAPTVAPVERTGAGPHDDPGPGVRPDPLSVRVVRLTQRVEQLEAELAALRSLVTTRSAGGDGAADDRAAGDGAGSPPTTG